MEKGGTLEKERKEEDKTGGRKCRQTVLDGARKEHLSGCRPLYSARTSMGSPPRGRFREALETHSIVSVYKSQP